MNQEEQLNEWADQLFDQLAAAPDGLTRDELMAGFNPSVTEVGCFHDIKGRLQDKLGIGDINVVGDSSTAMGGGWTYSLQGDPQNPIARDYQIRKIRNLFGRQCRAYMVARALATGTNGRTAEGRAARKLARSVWRVLEDTSDVLVELGIAPPSMPPQMP